MDRIKELITMFEETAKHPRKSVESLLARTGKAGVGCFPYYLPEELIYAAGLQPVGLWGGQAKLMRSDQYVQGFCCSIMRANLEQGLQGVYRSLSAVLIPAYCDTLKCIMEDWKSAVPSLPMIGFVYPQNRRMDAGLSYMEEELNRIKKELEGISGRAVTEQALLESIRIYDAFRDAMIQFTELVPQYPVTLNAKTRHLILKASYFSDKQAYTRDLNELMQELLKQPRESFRGVRAVLTGILAEPELFLDALVLNKVAVVADDLAHESRQFRTRGTSTGTGICRIAKRMLEQECSLIYDEEKSRGRLLTDLVEQSGADCVIIAMLKFCDPEEFDYPIYKKDLEERNILMLYLEIEQQMDSAEQINNRIQAFVEMIAHRVR